MANEIRLRQNLLSGTLTSSLTGSGTTMDSAELANAPAVDSTSALAITIDAEVVYVTAHTAGATSATIARAQEGTTGASHSNGATWVHAPTSSDFASPLGGDGQFGDGSDVAATLDGATNFNNWSSRSGSTYTLTRDAFLSSLVVQSGVILVTNGYRLYCSGTLSNAGTIRNDGNAGANATAVASGGGAGGTSTSPGPMANGSAGGAGGNAAAVGSGGGTLSSAAGGAGGAGGAGTSAGGAAGTASAITAASGGAQAFRAEATLTTGLLFTQGAVGIIHAGTGGGGGGGGATGLATCGGGGGAGGGIVLIVARTVVNSGTISANGGNGGNAAGGTGNAGGGGGGGGGLVAVIYRTLSNSGSIVANGGTHGTGFGTGAIGSDGNPGNVVQLQT